MSHATSFTPFASLSGGMLIGLAAVLLFAFTGRIAGISGIVGRLLLPASQSRPWEAAAFLLGLAGAPLLWLSITGVTIVQSVDSRVPLAAAAGLLVGFGTAVGNGCTSGHGVCGLSRLSRRSLAATATFMTVAVATVYVTRHVLGG